VPIDIKKKRNPARLLNNVLKGKVYLEMIEFPDKFILDLKVNSKKLSHAARMAAILSLWNSSMIKDKIGKYEKQ
jgi:predicted YcjX-like family ATPase